ncbi:MAG: class I SAM-dependent methyltransferase [Pyrinomonadaceae bacterium]
MDQISTDSVIDRDEQNLALVRSRESSDTILAEFYGKYPYPWKARQFQSLADPDFETVMLNQDIGDWSHRRIPNDARIWIAGCGVNQAIITALKFPKAIVLGSDISKTSVKLCTESAKSIGVSNLSIKNESINETAYKEEFDYIISTGVIHHNADPKYALNRLRDALKPDGILELMVYNRYHRTVSSAFQKAIRILNSGRQELDFEADLVAARKLINNLPEDNLFAAYLCPQWDQEDSSIADTLINPIEHSYTVESLADLASDCGLELLTYCLNEYDKMDQRYSWNMTFKDKELQQQSNQLPDLGRWQLSNLLLFERSPLLWFYLQRKESRHPRKSEQQICREFLDTTFKKNATKRTSFIRDDDGTYHPSPHVTAYPRFLFEGTVRKIYNLLDETRPIRYTLQLLNTDLSFQAVNDARLKLTTAACPYLRAI